MSYYLNFSFQFLYVLHQVKREKGRNSPNFVDCTVKTYFISYYLLGLLQGRLTARWTGAPKIGIHRSWRKAGDVSPTSWDSGSLLFRLPPRTKNRYRTTWLFRETRYCKTTKILRTKTICWKKHKRTDITSLLSSSCCPVYPPTKQQPHLTFWLLSHTLKNFCLTNPWTA